MNKNIYLAITVVVIIVLGVWWWQSQSPAILSSETASPAASQPTVGQENDNTAVIDQELNSVDVGNIDSEFQAIDSDLNSL